MRNYFRRISSYVAPKVKRLLNTRTVAPLNIFFALVFSSCAVPFEKTEEVLFTATASTSAISSHLASATIQSKTNTISPTSSSAVVLSTTTTTSLGIPTPTVDVSKYKDLWVLYVNESHGFQFEYPKLYDFPAKVTYGDCYVNCAPEETDYGEFYVGDWIGIEIEDYSLNVTPTPFTASWNDFIIDSNVPIQKS